MECEDYGYCISWWYIVSQMRKKYHLYATSKKPLSMGEIERMLLEIWNEYPGYAKTHNEVTE